MTHIDKETFFTALGFLAVIIKGENTQNDGATRAVVLAQLIKEFCQTQNPKLPAPQNDSLNPNMLDRLIERLKYNLESRHEAELPTDLGLVHGLYERLAERHRLYASDDLIADAVIHFLEEENRNKNEAHMFIVKVAGEQDIFGQCEKMATTIVEILKNEGKCRPTDLETKGFSTTDIKLHWAMSYALAKVELNWMDA